LAGFVIAVAAILFIRTSAHDAAGHYADAPASSDTDTP
jgi:hypothetical protein